MEASDFKVRRAVSGRPFKGSVWGHRVFLLLFFGFSLRFLWVFFLGVPKVFVFFLVIF